MNPFDSPPSGSPVSMPTPGGDEPGPRRGRTALVALLAVGLVGGGIAGVGQLVSADEPSLATATPSDDGETGDEPVAPADEDSDEDSGEGSDDSTPAPPPVPEGDVGIDGEIVIDLGDGDPLVIDLGELDVDRLADCVGLPPLTFDLDRELGEWGDFEPGDGPFGNLDELFGDEFFENLPALDEFGLGEGGGVTITGPDGVSVVDLGDSGSVTITKDGDDVTIEADGDATVERLDEVFGDLGSLFGDELDGELRLDELFGEFDKGLLDELLEGLPAFDELPEIESLDPEAVDECVAEVLDR